MNEAGASAPADPPPMPSAAWDEGKTLTRLCFGSCYAPQFKDSRVWRSIAAQKPDAFLYLGDNVYQRDENGRPELLELREAYGLLAADADFAAVRAIAPVLPVWDDHDYGMNGAGADFGPRLQSQALFKHVWAIPPDDPRMDRQGVYVSRVAGPPGRRVQVVMLDMRFFFTPATFLGEAQWAWLEAEFAEPADLRILASPIPVLCETQRLDGWREKPSERDRLLGLLERTNGVVIVSGDSHVGAHYRRDEGVAYPLMELTASSLNFPWREDLHIPPGPPDPARIGQVLYEANFGAVEIDWDGAQVTLALYEDTGKKHRTQSISLHALHPPKGPTTAERIVQAQFDAYNAQDLDALFSVYAEDCVVLDADGEVRFENRDAFRAQLEKTFAENPQNRAWSEKRIAVGDVVVDHEVGERFPGGPGFEIVAVYTVRNGLITRLVMGR